MHIPFERTIAGAYRFGFTNILSVIGIAWFPVLLLVAVAGGGIYMLAPQFVNLVQHLSKPGDPPVSPVQVEQMVWLIWTFYLVALPVLLIVNAMVRVGVMRKALGLIEGPVFIFFSLGGQVWRLLGAYALLLIGLWAYSFAATLACTLAWGILHASAPGFAIPVVALAGIALVCFGIYVFVRTLFFLPAVVVAEGVLGLGRSWELGGGNFWRIVGIVLVIFLPVLFVFGIIDSTLVQMTIMPLIIRHAGEAQTPAQNVAMMTDSMKSLMRFLPYFVVLQVVQAVLLFGIEGGAIATAYKAVTGREGEA